MKGARNTKKIILGICGSIAAYKACELIRELKRQGFEVKCILTAAGQKFITPLTLQTLSGQQVHTDLFAEYACDPAHIALAEYADLIAIVPATAETISRLSRGGAGDLLSSVVLSSRAKVLICPAMHSNMWAHPITRENVRRLQKIGYCFLGPDKGSLVSGEGTGRLAPTETIAKKIAELAGK